MTPQSSLFHSCSARFSSRTQPSKVRGLRLRHAPSGSYAVTSFYPARSEPAGSPALVIAIIVALDLPLTLRTCSPLFALGALAIGCDSGLESGSLANALTTLLGTWVGLFLILVDVALYVSLLMKRKWAQIGVRVLASWIIAISLLVLAFALRK